MIKNPIHIHLKISENVTLDLRFDKPDQMILFMDAVTARDLGLVHAILRSLLNCQYPELREDHVNHLLEQIQFRPQSRHGLSIALRFFGLLTIAFLVPIFFYFFHTSIASNFGELGTRIEIFLSTLLSVSVILLCEYFIYWKYER
jgi:hypothetical protein